MLVSLQAVPTRKRFTSGQVCLFKQIWTAKPLLLVGAASRKEFKGNGQPRIGVLWSLYGAWSASCQHSRPHL